jgi:hypothetical protein
VSQIIDSYDKAFIMEKMQGVIKTRAAPDVWETHKHIIARLYIEESKSLNEVMSIMERDYQLFGR